MKGLNYVVNISVAILFAGLFLISCQQPEKENKKVAEQASIPTTVSIEAILLSSLQQGDAGLKMESPFGFFQTGNFLDKKMRCAFTVSCTKDSTYLVKLYRIEDLKLYLLDSIAGLEANPSQFSTTYADYNFDGQTDIYIDVSMSSDFLFYWGHLITIDPTTKKLTHHPEARGLANIQADPKTKTIFSDEPITCRYSGKQAACKVTNEWINGQLKSAKKDCPCETFQQ
ncbi:hypothetical protein ESA94_09130 [Lacibacter luteus]|uniref:VCBS repeat-containing protein n=1 Tax=Lacibacter luteus TaxID=2508719 RepID=A0A4V1M7M7_9BACT|nr:hypothetical protein [Lacibacter luteus]RXK60615.1 hypothetical protein ESA94_09130 [Lacibacter luteus]